MTEPPSRSESAARTAALAHRAPIFTSHRQDWRTPAALYERLSAEFAFTLDPCPPEPGAYDGLLASWEGERVYVNPPYNACAGWMRKCWTEAAHAAVVVALVPARTDTAWFHDYAMRADEIRFLRGRLSFDDDGGRATFPSCVIVWL